jgi:hypothetical protein
MPSSGHTLDFWAKKLTPNYEPDCLFARTRGFRVSKHCYARGSLPWACWRSLLLACVLLAGARSAKAQDPSELQPSSPEADAGSPQGDAAQQTAPDEDAGSPQGDEAQQTAPEEDAGSPEGDEAQQSAPAEDAGSPEGDDGLIVDPELAGSPPSEPAPSGESNGVQLQAADVRLVLHARVAHDLRQEDPREEIWEATSIAALDATLRRSESLRFSLGMLARYHVAALAHEVPDAASVRYEFDAIPTAGYVDTSVAPGWHLRVGYQPVQLGRFDVFSASNVLAVHDLRDGFATLPEVAEVGQLALLSDVDVTSWLSLRAIYVPFFTPHIVSVTEGDYALFPSRQADVDNVINTLGPVVPADQLRSFLVSNLSRADRARIASSGLAALAPPPTLGSPQGALRASAHSSAGELAMTLGTALEHLPVFRVSDALLNAATTSDPTAAAALAAEPRPIRVEYNRFAVIAVDGAIDVDPISIGFELAYMLHRTLYAVGTADSGSPYAVPIPDTTDIAQLGARVEYVQTTRWLFALEAFLAYTMALPSDHRRGWLFFEGQRFFGGAGGMLGYTADFGLHLELGGAVLSGATFIAAPRISYAVLPNFEIEAGALFVEGRPPPMLVTPSMSIGGLFDTVDHGFIGLRYAP